MQERKPERGYPRTLKGDCLAAFAKLLASDKAPGEPIRYVYVAVEMPAWIRDTAFFIDTRRAV